MTSAPTDHPLLRRAASIALDVGQPRAADLLLALRFLNPEDRNAALTFLGFLALLSEIVHGKSDDGDDTPSSADGSGCACGQGGIEMRRQVARNIIDFACEDPDAATCGRPEIEAFHHLQNRVAIPRQEWYDLVDGWPDPDAPLRVATRDALQRRTDRTVRALVSVSAGLFNLENPALAPAIALVRGIALGRDLLAFRVGQAPPNHLVIPLADVATARWTDQRFLSTLVDDPLDPRVVALFKHTCDQAATDVIQGAALVDRLPTRAGRAALLLVHLWTDLLARIPTLDPTTPNLRSAIHPIRWRAVRRTILNRTPTLQEPSPWPPDLA